MIKNYVMLITGILVFAADQTAKFFVVHVLHPHESIPIIKNLFHITLVLNAGCAFGLMKGLPNALFLVVSFAVVVFFIFLLGTFRGHHVLLRLALMLLVAGSLSNLVDRIRFGYVIDFLDFRIWPVFNLGDTAITCGAGLIVLSMIKVKSKKSKGKS